MLKTFLNSGSHFTRAGWISFHNRLSPKFNSSLIQTNQSFHSHSQLVQEFNSIQPVDVAFIKQDPPLSTFSASAQKPPLIIYHGMFGSKENWRSLGKMISAGTGRSVYSLDVRNHGDSPHTDRFDFLAMAADVRHLIKNRLNLEKAILLGHSLGGRAMFQLSVIEPRLVEKLIVVDIHPTEKPADSIILTDQFVPILVKALEKLEQLNSTPPPLSKARTMVDKILEEHIDDKFIRQFFLMSLTEIDGKIAWKFNTLAFDRFLKGGDVNTVYAGQGFSSGPTLSIYGDKSEFMNERHQASFQALCPNIKFVRIAGAGHYLHVTHYQQFVQHVIDFVRT